MESKKIQELLKHHIEDILVITDKNGYITWTNNWFTKLTEYTFEEVKGKKPGNVLQGKDTDKRTVDKMRNAIASHQKFNINIVNYSKSRKKYWLNINCFPVFDNTGSNVDYFIAIERDITSKYEENQLKLNALIDEQERLSSEKSELIELIYVLTHDLKAPLNNIKGLTEILQTEDQDILNMISDEVLRSSTLINKILANRNKNCNKINLEFSKFSLLEVIQNLKKTNKTNLNKSKLSVNIDYSNNFILNSDIVLVTQILENIFVNAIKYAKQSTKITFKLEENFNI